MLPRILLIAALTALLSARAFAAAPSHSSIAETTGAAGAGAVHETHGGGEESGSLLPDMQSKDTYYSAVWVLIIFAVMLIVLYPTAWKNVLAGLKKREERIRADIADAEKSRQRAEATLKEYNTQLASAQAQIRDMLAKAQADGEKLATSIRMQAQKEAEDAKDRAVREIDASKKAAIGQIYEQAAELATSVASKILRRNLNADDQKQLVRESLDQLQTIK